MSLKRGPIIHGVLLILMLGFAYQTWTREKKVKPKTGNFVVWSMADGALASLVFETKNRSIRIEKRGEGSQAYYWGTETRTRKKIIRKPKSADKDAGPSKPDHEMITTKREFPIGDKGEELIANFTNLRALRKLGKLGDKEKKDYKIDGSIDQLTVSFKGAKANSLVLGGRVHGKANRYVLNADTDEGFVIAGPVISPLNSGETTLSLKKLHAYEEKAVKKATIEADGKTRELLRITVPGPKGRDGKPRGTRTSWADPATPDKADQTMANVLGHVDRLRPSEYKPDLKTDGMTKLVRVVYKDHTGKQIGFFEMYKKPLPKPAEPDGAFGPTGVPTPGAPVPKGAATPAPKGAATPAPKGKAAPTKKAAPKGKAPAKPAAKPAGKKTGELMVVEGPNVLADWSGWNQQANPKVPGVPPMIKPRFRRPVPGKRPLKPGAKPVPGKAGKAGKAGKPGAKPTPHRPAPPPRNLPPHLRRPKKAKAPTAEYFVLTERTRVLGKVRAPAAERLESDLKQLFK